MNYVLSILPVAVLILSVFLAIRAAKHGRKTKAAPVSQLVAFMIVCAVTIIVPTVISTATDDSTNATTTSVADGDTNTGKEGPGLLAAGLVTGLAGIGGGIAVGIAFLAATDATAEDPKSFGKSLIFIMFGEDTVLCGLLISILTLSKI